MSGLTGISSDEFSTAAQGAIAALRANGVDAVVFDMVMGIEYQTRNQWTSGRRTAKKPYVYLAILAFTKVVNTLAETNSFKVDSDMGKKERRARHATIIREQIGRVG